MPLICPLYVENELRGYLDCGDCSLGFLRHPCDACQHDVFVPFHTTAEACAQAAVPAEVAAYPEGTASNEEWATWLQQWWIAFLERAHSAVGVVAALGAADEGR